MPANVDYKLVMNQQKASQLKEKGFIIDSITNTSVQYHGNGKDITDFIAEKYIKKFRILMKRVTEKHRHYTILCFMQELDSAPIQNRIVKHFNLSDKYLSKKKPRQGKGLAKSPQKQEQEIVSKESAKKEDNELLF